MDSRHVILIAASLWAAGCGGGGGGSPGPTTPIGDEQVALVAAAELGMNSVDRQTSVFALMPPFDVVRAQVVRQRPGGATRLLDEFDVELTYEALADPAGSINTHSVGKTDFWQHAQALLGVNLAPGQGLTGLYMPGDAPQPGPQAMDFKSAPGWFVAQGIPIVPYDDAGQPQAYPMLRISARSLATGKQLAQLDVVAPVSDEVDCAGCHVTGGIAASDFGVPWSNHPDVEVQSRENVLLLHDTVQGTTLFDEQPVLCIECHYSVALDIALTGPTTSQLGNPILSRVLHRFHGQQLDLGGQPVFPPGGSMESTCYRCHPGQTTQAARGAMIAGGLGCFACHGDMIAVGAVHDLLPGGSLDGMTDGMPRRPWIDMPRCQSCHSGDALGHLSGPDLVPAPDGIRLLQAWRTGDPSASPLLAVNKRFAENDGTLYRFSRGHGGVACQGCHGSTHAEWPNADPGANDNLASLQLQGHAGVLSECTACHVAGALPLTLSGPHGLHPVGDQDWVDAAHGKLYAQAPTACQACHAIDLSGSVLSRTATARQFALPDGTTKVLAAGTQVGCALCHPLP